MEYKKELFVKIGKNVCVDAEVEIGPFSIIEEGVSIGSGTKIGSHVYLGPYTNIGKNNFIAQGSVIGGYPQDRYWMGLNAIEKNEIKKKYAVHLGNDNIVNEYVTIHHGLKRKTLIGDRNLIMGQVHLAHDVVLRNNINIANQSILGGEVFVEDSAFISGNVSIHQKVLLGGYSMIEASSYIKKDVPPYSLIIKSLICGVNVRGLKKFKFPFKEIEFIKRIYSFLFFRRQPLSKGILDLESVEESLKESSRFGLCEKDNFYKIINEFFSFLKQTKQGILKCPDYYIKKNEKSEFFL